MPVQLASSSDSLFVEMRLDGKVSCENLRQAIDELTQIEKRLGINSILVDASELLTGPPFFDYFAIMCELPPELVFAMYATGRQTLAERLQFGETVACNRCRRVRHFDDRDTALTWLLQQR